MILPQPTAGTVVVIVASVRTDVASWLQAQPWRAEAHFVPAAPPAAPTLPWRVQMRAGGRPIAVADPVLSLTPELVPRMGLAFAALTPAERYFVGVVRAVVDRRAVLVLEQPSGSVPALRLVRLVAGLQGLGQAVVVVDRRLRALASLAAPVWLLDAATLRGPRAGAGLQDDPDALGLCLGGTLETPQAKSPD